jgi:hypothetical protein
MLKDITNVMILDLTLLTNPNEGEQGAEEVVLLLSIHRLPAIHPLHLHHSSTTIVLEEALDALLLEGGVVLVGELRVV